MKQQLRPYGLSPRGLKILIPTAVGIFLLGWLMPLSPESRLESPVVLAGLVLGIILSIAAVCYGLKRLLGRKENFYRNH